jgi:hypothetical protein
MGLLLGIQVGANINTISRIISLAKILCHLVQALDMSLFLFLFRKQNLVGNLLKLIQKKWTRSGVYGNVDVTQYNVKKYNGAGIYIGFTTKYVSKASSTYVKSRNK